MKSKRVKKEQSNGRQKYASVVSIAYCMKEIEMVFSNLIKFRTCSESPLRPLCANLTHTFRSLKLDRDKDISSLNFVHFDTYINGI
jgi:hypothetical protein